MSPVSIPGEGSHTMRTHNSEVLRQVIAIRDDHAPFSGSQVLIGEKTEAAHVAKGADHLAVDGSAGRMGGVLDDGKIVLSGYLRDLTHSAWVSAVVYNGDSPGALVDTPLNGTWRDV